MDKKNKWNIPEGETSDDLGEEARDLPAVSEDLDALMEDLRETQEDIDQKKARIERSAVRREESRKRQKTRKRIVRRIWFVLFLLAAAAAAFCYIRFAPNREYMDPEAYFTEQLAGAGNEAGLQEDELAVVMHTWVDYRPARLVDGALYLDYDMVRENIFTRFFWDAENEAMLYTTATDTWEIPVNSKDYEAEGKTETYDRVIALSDERGIYLSADFLQQYANYEYTTDEEARHVVLHYDWGEYLVGTVRSGSAVRYGDHIKSPILTKVEKGDEVYVLEELEKWTLVVTQDGYTGYIRSGRLENIREQEVTRQFEETEIPSQVRDEKINLIWHRIGLQESNDNLKEDIKGMTGVNVISPTWITLADDNGNVYSIADAAYVKQAHKSGLEVWGLVSNFDPNVSTTQMLSSTFSRNRLVGNLVGEALSCGMDGINLDLEAITEEASWGYVQLVRELSVACRKNELVLSVDIPVPMSFNTYYDRKELGAFADYLIIMGYDEHYVGSEAGSVASLSFEESGITETLKAVPAKKIISGVPFYTRLWFSAVDADGNESVWSEAYGMDIISETIETYGVTPVWDDSTGQYYVKWTLDDGTTCQIWVEDEESLALKAGLVKKYELGGIASWALGYERSSIWDVLSEHIA